MRAIHFVVTCSVSVVGHRYHHLTPVLPGALQCRPEIIGLVALSGAPALSDSGLLERFLNRSLFPAATPVRTTTRMRRTAGAVGVSTFVAKGLCTLHLYLSCWQHAQIWVRSYAILEAVYVCNDF